MNYDIFYTTYLTWLIGRVLFEIWNKTKSYIFFEAAFGAKSKQSDAGCFRLLIRVTAFAILFQAAKLRLLEQRQIHTSKRRFEARNRYSSLRVERRMLQLPNVKFSLPPNTFLPSARSAKVTVLTPWRPGPTPICQVSYP